MDESLDIIARVITLPAEKSNESFNDSGVTSHFSNEICL